MDICPYCNKKLLSQSSKYCNWCSRLIEDPAYQEEAEIKRDIQLTQSQLYHANPRIKLPGDVPQHPAIARRMDAEVEANLRKVRELQKAKKKSQDNDNSRTE